jgi:hypothetical protein
MVRLTWCGLHTDSAVTRHSACQLNVAGPFAEAQFTGRQLFCAGDDEAGIVSAMPHLPEPREHYEAKAKALVLENWNVIEVVADELLIGPGRLYGEMLDVAIRCARP